MKYVHTSLNNKKYWLNTLYKCLKELWFIFISLLFKTKTTYIGNHWYSQCKHKYAAKECEFDLSWSKVFRPVVNQSSLQNNKNRWLTIYQLNNICYFDLEIKLLIELTISDSTQQNCESAPRQNNIKKNKIDQRPEGSSCRTTYNYKNINRYI